jgi:hypothetical protein
MRAYLVRFAETKALLGIFISPSKERLWWYVDEAADVRDCEYLPLPPGGMYPLRAETPKVPALIAAGDLASHPDWFRGAVVSEYWNDIFLSDRCDGERSAIVAAKQDQS